MRIKAFAICAIAAIVGSSPVFASRFSDIAVFGDSLSDVGNVYTLTSWVSPLTQVYPAAPYFAGRLSNGPLWVDHIGAALGLQNASKPWLQGGTNYAFGGANTDIHNASIEAKLGPLSSLGTWGVTTQIAAYISGHPNPRSDVLNVVWAGSNDFLDGRTDPLQSALNTAFNIALLHESSNGREFLVPNLAPLGSSPRYLQANGSGGDVQLNARVSQYNAYLNAALDGLQSFWPDMHIYRMDVFGAFNQILQQPSAFGFDNVTQPAYDESNGTVVPDPSSYLFWDNVHPTARGHALLAQLAYASLPADAFGPGAVVAAVPEPMTLTLLAVGLLAMSQRRGRR